MNKNLKNIVSICMLATILCALIITITALNKAENLNISNSTNNENKQNETITQTSGFTFQNAKEHINENINFENNFGGSNNDQVHDVFKLENYYLIGTSQSTDFYFENTTQNTVFILICDGLGNTQSIYTYEFENGINYITSKLFNNDFYILISSNCTTLLKFNLQTNEFNVSVTTNSTPIALLISGEPIIVCKQNNKTEFNFVLSQTQFLLEENTVNIVLGCEYLNGTLIMLNTTNKFLIGMLTKNHFEMLQTFNNFTTTEINITDKNFIISAKSLTEHKILILDMTFNLVNELTLNTAEYTKLLNINNTNYLFYKQNNLLKVISFCNHAEQLNTALINSNTTNFNILLLNNNFYAFVENLNNQLEILTLDLSFNLLRKTTLNTSKNFNIVSLTPNHNSAFMVGNFNNPNQIITTTFGNTDFYVAEIKL